MTESGSSPWDTARQRVAERQLEKEESRQSQETTSVPASTDEEAAVGAEPRGQELEFFATSPRGIEDLLARELLDHGASAIETSIAGVSFRGDLQTAYRACLWSRFASRILLPLGFFRARNADDLYAGVTAIPWEEHLAVDGTLAVSARLKDAEFDNSHFVSLRTKDAIVDRFRRLHGGRPGVDLNDPDLSLYVFLDGDEGSVGIDLAGVPLHRRGYRRRGVAAPLKENLAAALLARAGWPRLASQGSALYDPMCGSGTLLIEGAMMASDWAPGLDRSRFGFDRWLGHDSDVWSALLEEARRRRRSGLSRLPTIAGGDGSESAIAAARDNLARVGLDEQIIVRVEGLSLASPPPQADHGLLITNPPWGHRLGDEEELAALYSLLGRQLRSAFDGWQAAILGPDEATLREVGLRWFKVNKLFHGPLPCRLAHYRIGRSKVR